MATKRAWLGAISLIGPSYPMIAHAEVYMNDEQAVQALFPEKTFTRMTTELTAAEKSKIEKESDENVRSKNLIIWKNPDQGVIFIDQVIGKHEFITYAVGIGNDGKVVGIEILEYRESYGHQIRNQAWRQQFVGKTKEAQLVLDEDIKNISGATLSTSHVTKGVKRLLHTYNAIRSRI